MKQRILIVEDNPANLELLRDWLESEGFEVTSAENLAEGYAALKGDLPHALLLDVQLGSEDGMELAVWIRKEPRLSDLPVIAVTAHAMITDQKRVMQAGCNASVSKPIDFRVLRSQLDRWLGVAANLPPRA